MDTKLFLLTFIIFNLFPVKKDVLGSKIELNSHSKSELNTSSNSQSKSKHHRETKPYTKSDLSSRYESSTKQIPKWDVTKTLTSNTNVDSQTEHKFGSKKRQSRVKSHFGHKSDSKRALYLKTRNPLSRHKSKIKSKSNSKSKLTFESKLSKLDLKTQTDLKKGSINLDLKPESHSKSNHSSKSRSKSHGRWRRRLRACDRLFESINHIVDARLRQAGLNLDHTTPGVDLSTRIPSKVSALTLSLTKVQNLVQEVQEAQQVLSLTQKELLTTINSQSLRLDRFEHNLTALDSVVQNLSRVAEQLHHALGGDVDSVGDGTTQMGIGVSPIPITTEPTVLPRDCEEIYQKSGMKLKGDFFLTIWPSKAPHKFKVRCRIYNNTAWVLVQRRKDGSVNFFRDWEDYKKGFGNLDGEFWIGNDNLHYLTNQAETQLQVELQTWDTPQTSYHAFYSNVRVASEADLYRLHVSGFRDDISNAGDSLTSMWESHTEQPFSTHDRDHDNRYYDNCADLYHGAWWFGNCFDSHLNGRYYRTPHHDDYFRRDGIQWNSLHLHASLMKSEIMIAPAQVMSNDIDKL